MTDVGIVVKLAGLLGIFGVVVSLLVHTASELRQARWTPEREARRDALDRLKPGRRHRTCVLRYRTGMEEPDRERLALETRR